MNALGQVEAAHRGLLDAEYEEEKARQALWSSVREAYRHGVKPWAIAKRCGLSTPRVLQIVDDR